MEKEKTEYKKNLEIFMLRDGTEFKCEWWIAPYGENTQIYVHFLENKNNGYDFQTELNGGKISAMKGLGAYVANHLWGNFIKPLLDENVRKAYFIYNFRYKVEEIPQHKISVKELNKLKSYAYLRARKISSVIIGKAWKQYLADENITPELMKRLEFIAWKLSNKSKGRMCSLNVSPLVELYHNVNPDLFEIILNDLGKYHTAMGRWIMDQFYYSYKGVSFKDLTMDKYIGLIKSAPLLIRKNKYGLHFNSEEIRGYNGNIPQTRYNWFTLRLFCAFCLHSSRMDFSKSPRSVFTRKLHYSDISVWHHFRKKMHIKGPYSTRELNHMISTVEDGDYIYTRMKDNPHGISFVPIEGSAMRMIRNAIYNHHQEQEYTKTSRLKDTKDAPMWNPPVKLPDWIESIRIRTKHELIKAGIECEHCIGNYVDNRDIFVREKNICAQIDRDKLNVLQCFDVKDQITKESENLKRRLQRDLDKLVNNKEWYEG